MEEKVNQKGPMKIEYNFLSCNGCDFLKSEMISSGENPQYNFKCLHPDVMVKFSWGGEPLFIEMFTSINQIPTPDWCPFLNKK